MDKFKSFLIEMYSNEYFIYILIGTIVFLIILFLIVLFFGKKDEKKRKLEETMKLENASLDAFKESTISSSVETVAENQVVEKPLIENKPEPIIQENRIFEPIKEPSQKQLVNEVNNNLQIGNTNNELISKENSTINLVETKVVNTTPVVEPIKTNNIIEENVGYQAKPNDEVMKQTNNPTQTFKFNFDELANSIDQELNVIEEKKAPTETFTMPILEKQEPVETFTMPILEEKQETLNVNNNENKENVFSSVYINKKPEMSTTITHNNFELPKQNVALEKTVEEVPNINDLQNIALKNIEKKNNINSFSELTGETYNINEG